MTNGKSIVRTVTGLIEMAATKYKVAPYDVTSAQFWSVASGKVDEWQVRTLGGLTNIRDLEFPPPEEPNHVDAAHEGDFHEQKLLEIVRRLLIDASRTLDAYQQMASARARSVSSSSAEGSSRKKMVSA